MNKRRVVEYGIAALVIAIVSYLSVRGNFGATDMSGPSNDAKEALEEFNRSK